MQELIDGLQKIQRNEVFQQHIIERLKNENATIYKFRMHFLFYTHFQDVLCNVQTKRYIAVKTH